ncbi:cell division control protein 6 homolog [Glandiceps talaboti]
MSSRQTTIQFQCRKTRSQSKAEGKRSTRVKDCSDPATASDVVSSRRKRRQAKEKEENQLPTTPKCSPRKIKCKENISTEDIIVKKCSVRISPVSNVSPVKLPCGMSRIDYDINTTPVKTVKTFSSSGHLPVMILPSPKKKLQYPSPRKVETILSSPSKRLNSPSPTKKHKPLRLQRQEGECYQRVKRALHTSMPDNLLCRETEIKVVTDFLRRHVGKQKPGSLYISGAPGTGKTATLMQIIENNRSEFADIKVIFVNCMSIKNSTAIYNKVISQLSDNATYKSNSKDAVKYLEKKFSSSGPPVLLILDEIDQLDSKNQEILYTMFEWPSLPKSRLVLIGIANALDFTDRILPRLQARPKCKPQLLNFPPYTKDQIVTILQDRLEKTKCDGQQVVDAAAVQFCARKVAAIAGDMRKALDVCRRAVEVVESDVRSQMVLQPSSEASLPPSPRKLTPKRPIPKKVSLVHISNVVSEVYGSRMMSSSKNQEQSFPVQQKLIICTLLLMLKQGKAKEITVGKLHDTYCSICKSRQMGSVDQSEFLSLCTLLETRGIIGLKKGKDTRLTKVYLRLEEKEVEFALQDKVMMSSILSAGLPSKK